MHREDLNEGVDVAGFHPKASHARPELYQNLIDRFTLDLPHARVDANTPPRPPLRKGGMKGGFVPPLRRGGQGGFPGMTTQP